LPENWGGGEGKGVADGGIESKNVSIASSGCSSATVSTPSVYPSVYLASATSVLIGFRGLGFS
jgi:hypothetical protein